LVHFNLISIGKSSINVSTMMIHVPQQIRTLRVRQYELLIIEAAQVGN